MTIRDGSRGRYGQTIYQLMLVMTCAALAIAATFPILDCIQQYRGPIQGGASVAAMPKAAETFPQVTTTTLAPGETAPATTLPATAPAPETPAGG